MAKQRPHIYEKVSQHKKFELFNLIYKQNFNIKEVYIFVKIGLTKIEDQLLNSKNNHIFV